MKRTVHRSNLHTLSKFTSLPDASARSGDLPHYTRFSVHIALTRLPTLLTHTPWLVLNFQRDNALPHTAKATTLLYEGHSSIA
jgi:hypothetical protein